MKIKLYINPYSTGHDEYSIGWWAHRLFMAVHIRNWYPLYRIWWFLNYRWPGWKFQMKGSLLRPIYNHFVSKYPKEI